MPGSPPEQGERESFREMASERRYRDLLDLSPAAVYVNRDNRIEYVNRAALVLFGAERPEELLGKSPFDLFHPDCHDLVRKRIEILLQGERAPLVDERIVRLDGTVRDVQVAAAPFRDERGVAIQVVLNDVTDRKRAERAVKESERVYRAIGESIDFGVWICAPDGRNTYASDSFLALVGMTQRECSQFGWGEALHPDDAQRTIAAWKECVRTGGTWDVEHRFRGVDGEWHPVLARGVPVRGDHGEILCWAGINLDIGRLKAAEKALLDADRRKDEFLAMLSHELRNPLAAIQNAYHVLERSDATSEHSRRAREAIGRQSRQLARLVDDLLEVIRISRGKIRIRKALVDLAEIVRHAADDHRPLFANLELALEVKEPPAPVLVDGDAARLAQVVGNLLQNASKFTHAGGHVWVEVRSEGASAVLSVRDDGAGIEHEMLGLVFDPFTQADRTLDRSRGGLGLGLALVKGLVRLHGGTVEVRSEGEGRGAEFVVRLPVVTEEVPGAARQEGREGASPRKRILVIEDNHDAATTLRDLLELEGHDVVVASDGQEGLAAAASAAPDVILCDLGVPVVDGYEVARRLRQQGVTTRLVAISGYAAPDDVARAHRAGFDAHLSKPPDARALLAVLAGA